jgi:hypothetical protein
VIVSARSSVAIEGRVDWRSIDLRLSNGKLLRSANYFADSQHCILARNLPDRVGGRVDWKHGDFIPLLPGSRDRYLHNAAVSVQNGKSGFIRIRAALDEELMVEWGRTRMRNMTQRALERLVIVDGQVWKETNWPRIRLAEDRALMAQLAFDEQNESVRPHYGRLASDHRMLLLSQAHKIREIADEAGLPLAEGYQVVVDHMAFDVLPYMKERVVEAWRAATTLEHRVSSIIGEQSAAVVSSWLALREAVSKRDPEMTVDEIVDLVIHLRKALGCDHQDIIDETDRMLMVLDIDGQETSPARSMQGRRNR